MAGRVQRATVRAPMTTHRDQLRDILHAEFGMDDKASDAFLSVALFEDHPLRLHIAAKSAGLPLAKAGRLVAWWLDFA